MIPYDIDPSLYTGEPETPVLNDGFSPARRGEAATAQKDPEPAGGQVDPAPEANSPS